MVNTRLKCARERKLRREVAAVSPPDNRRPADASTFMKIRRVFAANTGKIANGAFKPLC
jgi:hypothetical protein